MRYRILTAVLAVMLIFTLSACNLRDILRTADRIEEDIENTGDNIENAVENAVTDAITPNDPAANAPVNPPSDSADGAADTKELTEAEAQEIALQHAGLTAEEVTGLHVRYDLDDGVPEYEVKFYHDRFEYDYDIHAKTGDIRSVDRDD